MADPLGKLETRKDTIQVAVESGATHVGSVMSIVLGAVRDVTFVQNQVGHSDSKLIVDVYQ